MIKEIPLYPGYFADEVGNIYSIWTNQGMSRTIPKKLKPGTWENGYKHVNIRIANKKYYSAGVHRLVCMTFNRLPKKGETASHLNGVRDDNRAKNIIWESLKKNHARKKQHGTDDNGFRNSRAKINKNQYIEILALLKNGRYTHEKIGEMFGVNRVFITKINTKQRYNMNR